MSEQRDSGRESKSRFGEIFVGGRVLLIAFLGTGVSVSTTYLLSLSIFVKPMADEFGWGRGVISTASLVVNIVLAVLIPQVGRLVDRIGSMPVVIVSTIAYAGALASLGAFTVDLWSYFGLVVLLALLGAGSTPPPLTKLLVANFHLSRGVALGIALSGVGLGTAIISVLLAPYVAQHGWRNGYLMLGAGVFLGAVVMAALWMTGGNVRHAFARPRPASPATAGLKAETPLVKDRTFWLIAAIFYFAAFGILTLVAHFVPMLTDAGMSLAEAGVLAGNIGLAMVAGRIVTGFLLDVVRAEHLGAVLFLFCAAGMLLLAFGGREFALLAAIVAGFGVGAEIDLMAFLVGKHFGLQRYGAVYGGIYGIFLVGTSSGSVVAGFLFDITGTYMESLLVASASLTLAALLLVLLSRMDRIDLATKSLQR
ncbi:MAG: MFS transporter [Hyphomonadaceae bacterium]|nr:MFS transporter [Hyphomonadaceae bacterium]